MLQQQLLQKPDTERGKTVKGIRNKSKIKVKVKLSPAVTEHHAMKA
jgi:hypothetical protein